MERSDARKASAASVLLPSDSASCLCRLSMRSLSSCSWSDGPACAAVAATQTAHSATASPVLSTRLALRRDRFDRRLDRRLVAEVVVAQRLHPLIQLVHQRHA